MHCPRQPMQNPLIQICVLKNANGGAAANQKIKVHFYHPQSILKTLKCQPHLNLYILQNQSTPKILKKLIPQTMFISKHSKIKNSSHIFKIIFYFFLFYFLNRNLINNDQEQNKNFIIVGCKQRSISNEIKRQARKRDARKKA